MQFAMKYVILPSFTFPDKYFNFSQLLGFSVFLDFFSQVEKKFLGEMDAIRYAIYNFTLLYLSW